MLSIVNPAEEFNGASTVTRGLLRLLSVPPLCANVELQPAWFRSVGWRGTARAWAVLRSATSSLPSKAAFLYSSEFRERIRRRLKAREWDLIIINGSDLLWVVDLLPAQVPRILVEHNIEHRLFAEQIETLPARYQPFKPLLRSDCKRLERYEWDGARAAGNILFLSIADLAYARARCEGLRAIALPPVFDYQPARRERPQPASRLHLGFLGDIGWWPNRVGLRWFQENVLPHLDGRVYLHLFGSHDGSASSNPNLVHHGVTKLEEVWQTCHITICPALSTVGVRVKLAEAAYNGVPVLATRHAATGLPLPPDPALVFLDRPEEWIAFLNGNAANKLAEETVSDGVRAAFSVETHRAALHDFVFGALRADCAS